MAPDAEKAVSSIPARTIERICAYRQRLLQLQADGVDRVFSHDLANLEGFTPAQVRRDIMSMGYSGSPAKGYEVDGLLAKAHEILDPAGAEGIALVGVGQLGRALLAYFSRIAGDRRNLSVAAIFDVDPEKTGRVINGTRCYDMADLQQVIASQNVRVAILAVPAEEGQQTADKLVAAGVKGIVSFVPGHLRVPETVTLEEVNITVCLEKVAYLTREKT